MGFLSFLFDILSPFVIGYIFYRIGYNRGFNDCDDEYNYDEDADTEIALESKDITFYLNKEKKDDIEDIPSVGLVYYEHHNGEYFFFRSDQHAFLHQTRNLEEGFPVVAKLMNVRYLFSRNSNYVESI